MRGPLNSIKKKTTKTLCLSSLFIQFKCERNGSSHIAAVGGTHELVARGWVQMYLLLSLLPCGFAGTLYLLPSILHRLDSPICFFFKDPTSYSILFHVSYP